MDPDRYCLDEAAPPGSSLYYATLFVGARARAALVAIHAFRHVLLDVVETIADANVRGSKLGWWSGEIMEARDGRARHPVSVAITRHCGAGLWFRSEVLTMLSAVARVSADDGFTSAAARDDFCNDVGAGTAKLCLAAVPSADDGKPPDAMWRLGAALEDAALAIAPSMRSGLARIPGGVSDSGDWPDRNRPGAGPDRIAEERARAHRALADAVRGIPRRGGATTLLYRGLSCIQLAALAGALRKPSRKAPLAASISPLRKLWIAWRVSHGAGPVDR